MISPENALIDKPGGRPLAMKPMSLPSGSDATMTRLTVVPSSLICGPGSVITGARFVLSTVQVKAISSNRLGVPSSVARTVTECVPAESKLRVPEMTPVPDAMARPPGRPVAVQVNVSPSGSEPLTVRLTVLASASV